MIRNIASKFILYFLLSSFIGMNHGTLWAQFEIDLTTRFGSMKDALRNFPMNSLEHFDPDHPSYAFVLQELAERYLMENTVNSRKKADITIRKALKFQPLNPEFRFTLIKILLAQGFFRSAEMECDSLINHIWNGPSDYSLLRAQVYFYKGWLAERKAFRYRNMLSTSKSGDEVLTDAINLNLNSYSLKDFLLAIGYYKKTLDLNINLSNAYQRLGMILFEFGYYTDMLKLFQQAVYANPDNKNNWLCAGLAAYHLKQFDISYAYYQKALTLLDKTEQSMLQNIDYIVEAIEYNQYNKFKSDSGQNQKFTNKFWNQNDPLYLTEYNERKLEHFNRMIYANLRFGVPRQHIEGWQTERGLIYIRYGKPKEWFRIQPDEQTLGGWEIWIYPDKVFRFKDEFATGYFLMDNPSVLTAASAYNIQSDEFNLPMINLPMNSRLYQFRSPEYHTQLLWVFRLDSGFIDQYKITDTTSQAGCFVLNSNYEILDKQIYKWNITKTLKSSKHRIGFFTSGDLPIASGSLNYSIELYWPSLPAVAVNRSNFTLRGFSGDSLMMSDVIMSERVTEFNLSKLLPLPDSVITKSDLLLYFEIYNLNFNQDGQSSYSVETRIRHRTAGLLPSIWNKLSGNRIEEVRSTFNVNCNKREDKYFLTVDLSNFENGNYIFDLLITDQQSNQSVLAHFPVCLKIPYLK
jgi:GWxTD domain-containing protein